MPKGKVGPDAKLDCCENCTYWVRDDQEMICDIISNPEKYDNDIAMVMGGERGESDPVFSPSAKFLCSLYKVGK